MHSLRVEKASGDVAELVLQRPLVVVGGFTGRDVAAVDRHIAELREMGVPEPDRAPDIYLVPNWLLSPGGRTLQVAGSWTSGEVEPVVMRSADGELYVTVGSDHTDRLVERSSIEMSKRVCPKVIGGVAWPLADVEPHWDQLRLESRVGPDRELYQQDVTGGLIPVRDLLGLLEQRLSSAGEREFVFFLGTVPMKNGALRQDLNFVGRLEDPVRDRSLVCEYEVEVIAVASEAESA